MTTDTAKLTLFIAEDDPLLRQLMMDRLATEDDFTVVGGAMDGREVLDSVARLKPSVVLLDLRLNGLHGMKVLPQLSALPQPPAVLVLSSMECQDTQIEAARNGAHGFLPKSQAVPHLSAAIRAVARGEMWFARDISEQVFREYHDLLRRVRDQERPAHQLTEKERDVLLCLARGMNNQQIAGELFMSVHTVKLHNQKIFKKLDIRNRTEAAVFAAREGLLDPSEAIAAA